MIVYTMNEVMFSRSNFGVLQVQRARKTLLLWIVCRFL